MKTFLGLIFILVSHTLIAQNVHAAKDTVTLPPHSLRVVGEVIHADEHMISLRIEKVVAYSRDVITTPVQGDDVRVRLHDKSKPGIKSKIEADLLEKIEVGALPSSYLMISYKTLELQD